MLANTGWDLMKTKHTAILRHWCGSDVKPTGYFFHVFSQKNKTKYLVLSYVH